MRSSIAQRLQQQPPNSFCWGMRCCGKDDRSEGLFKQNPVGRPYPADHPLRMSRQLVDAALAELSRAFAKVYARDGRPSIPPERLLSHGLTMGMVLSAPMLAIGIALLIHSAWMPRRLKPE